MDTIFDKKPIEESQTNYAGFWIRFAASLLDGIIIGIPMTFIMFIVFFLTFMSSGAYEVFNDSTMVDTTLTAQQVMPIIIMGIIVVILSIIIPVIYYAGMHASKWQATIGKKLLKLKVTDLNGNRISFLRALGRYLAMAFLSGIFYIGYIIAVFTEKKQSLHDLIAGTVVIKEEE